MFSFLFLLTSDPSLPPESTSAPVEPTLPDPGAYEPAFLKMLLTLGGLLLLIFFTLWALRKLSQGRMGGFGTSKRIKILEKRPLSPKSILYLVEVDGRKVFLAESQLDVRSLSEFSESEID